MLYGDTECKSVFFIAALLMFSVYGQAAQSTRVLTGRNGDRITEATLYCDKEEKAIGFAGDDLAKILKNMGSNVTIQPLSGLSDTPGGTYFVIGNNRAGLQARLTAAGGKPVGTLGRQSYALRVTGSGNTQGYWALGGDRVGTMYGGIHIGEIVAGGSLEKFMNEDQSPYITKRGLKFNIPLDYRNRTHDDRGTGPQLNIEHMWDINFWTEYLDVLARQRYNVLSLWNQHPFPHMVKLDDYPKAALDDVYKAGRPGKDYDNNIVKVKDLPIDDKIKHWTKVMEMARDRGIEIYIITWSIHLSRDRDINHLYGFEDNFRDAETKDYTRKSVKQLFLIYPLLAGIGVTAGENNMWDMSDDDKEDWLWDTYGQGVMDVKKEQPNRRIRFIHRYWQTSFDKLESRFGQLPDGYDMSYKYIKAHMYSRPDPHFAGNELIPKLPDGMLCWWNVRNDDIYNLRWGNPEFVKQFILHFPSDRTAGYYMGSDRYTWGRESISKNPLSPRQLENEKHWYSFLLWGRLGYDPDTPIPLLKGLIKYRFPTVSVDVLFEAWQAASRTIPLVNQVHWKDWDYLWWVEACISSGVAGAIDGYHDIDDFITIGTMPGSDITSISSFADGDNSGTSPLEAAGQIETYAQDVLAKIVLISDGGNMELKETIGDIKAQAYLGLYYAKKIRGAVDLSRYRKGKGSQYKTSAVRYLEESLEHWKDYASTLDAQYNKMVLAFNGLFDWDALEKEVENDIEIARNAN